MHRVLDAACRRTVGIAAGVVVVGGVTGAVLLTPGTAFASGPVSTTTAVTVTQTPNFGGATLNASVTVTPGSTANGAPTGSVSVSAGPGRACNAALSAVAGSPVDAAAGSCTITVPFGSYSVTAFYAGVPGTFDSSSGGAGTVTVGSAPVFGPAFPSHFVRAGQFYSATFHASGVPDPRYSLVGAPAFLQINPFTGTVFGTVPTYYYAAAFSYSVVASNPVGSAYIGPFTVYVQRFPQPRPHANLSTYLSCTPRVFSGQRGSCTLSVTNRGGGSAPDVTAQIALPRQLRADYCGYFYNFGCSINNNTAFENLGTLNPGQSRSLTVVFTARTAFNLWGFHPRHAFTVRVDGSASTSGGFFGNSTSYSFAYVTIIPF
jgi:hypothetical protein